MRRSGQWEDHLVVSSVGVVHHPTRYTPGVRPLKVIIERHFDGYIAYPVGVYGVVLGQGDSLDEAVGDLASALRFHISCFGEAEIDDAATPLAIFVDSMDLSDGGDPRPAPA